MEEKVEKLIKKIEEMQKEIRVLELDKKVAVDFIKKCELENDFDSYLTEIGYFEELEELYHYFVRLK